MERRLPIASALMNAGRILGYQLSQEIRTSEVRSRTGVGNGSVRNQPFGGCPGRGVEGMESARPPITPPVRICAEIEEHVDHREIVGEGDNGRRIERKQRVVDSRAELRICLEEHANGACVATSERVMHA